MHDVRSDRRTVRSVLGAPSQVLRCQRSSTTWLGRLAEIERVVDDPVEVVLELGELAVGRMPVSLAAGGEMP